MTERWSYSAGEHGERVHVYERSPGGMIYIRIQHPSFPDGYVRRSLEHRDRDRAKTECDRAAAELREGTDRVVKQRLTLGEVFRIYEQQHMKGQRPQYHAENRRKLDMWKRILGAGTDAGTLSPERIRHWIPKRASGAVDARGLPVPSDRRRPVGGSTVGEDVRILKHVLSWASTYWSEAAGGYLLPQDPLRGLETPEEKNPRRPVATRDRYRAVRAKADQVTARFLREGHYLTLRCYLAELLDLVVGTGRRISAVCQLRYEDLDLRRSPERPYGAIAWPGETDKKGKRWVTPMGPTAAAAVARVLEERPGIGRAWLFPSCHRPERALPHATADNWLKEAERLAKVDTQEQGLWHPYRRMWATERRHLPRVDVAQAGGWSDPKTMERAYQHAEEATVRDVVLEADPAFDSSARPDPKSEAM